MKKGLLGLLLLCWHVAYAASLINLDLQQVNVSDALQTFAKETGRNIVISANVSGTVSLHLKQVPEEEAFRVILASQDLTSWRIGSVIFVGTRAELATRQDELAKQRVLLETHQALVTQLFAIRYAKAQEILHFLQGDHALLSPRGQINVDERSNQISVTDVPGNIREVKKLLRDLDVPLKQIRIQARLASVDNDFERELGILYDAVPGDDKDAGLGFNPKHYSLAVAHLPNGSYLNVALAAMENQGRGELISSPSLFTLNQQTATIESGEEIPYQEVSLSGGTAISFKKAVLRLRVTPQVLPRGKILLELQVNQDRPSDHIVQGVPAISTRQITTHVLVNNGQTLVLGGIFELNKELNEQRVPFLGRIPLLGHLFSDRVTKANKRELLIFVTPKIIECH